MTETTSPTSESYELLSRLPMATLITDDDGYYVFANPAACELLGRTSAEIVGRTVRDVAPGGFDLEGAWTRFLADGRQEGEFVLQHAGGSPVTVQFRAATNFLPGRHVSVMANIADRKRVESQLRLNEELYAKAFNTTPAPTNIRKLSTGTFVDVNEAFTEATGYWRAEVMGRTGESLRLWKDTATLNAMLEDLRAGAPVARTRARLLTKDRADKDFSVAMRAVEIHGEPHVIAVYSDIATL